jgi:hypothetical protein
MAPRRRAPATVYRVFSETDYLADPDSQESGCAVAWLKQASGQQTRGGPRPEGRPRRARAALGLLGVVSALGGMTVMAASGGHARGLSGSRQKVRVGAAGLTPSVDRSPTISGRVGSAQADFHRAGRPPGSAVSSRQRARHARGRSRRRPRKRSLASSSYLAGRSRASTAEASARPVAPHSSSSPGPPAAGHRPPSEFSFER